MTRLTTIIALVLFASITGCQDDTKSNELVMAPTFGRSPGEAAPITGETQLAQLRQVTAKFHEIDVASRPDTRRRSLHAGRTIPLAAWATISATRTCSTRPSIC